MKVDVESLMLSHTENLLFREDICSGPFADEER